MTAEPDFNAMLGVALAEARQGLAEGGIPIGAAICDAAGRLMGAGHNRRVTRPGNLVARHPLQQTCHIEFGLFRRLVRWP
jgi:tRNA(Arg) A34 adenosine deaminase TadA